MRNRYQRAVRRGGWKYLKVAEREFLFDIAYDPRERGDLSKRHPELLAELRALWEDWDRDMLRCRQNAVTPMSNLSRCSGSAAAPHGGRPLAPGTAQAHSEAIASRGRGRLA